MLRKLIQHKNLLSIGLMIVISCLIQVLAVMKSSLVAGYFGASTEMDAFQFANSIVSFIFGFFASGITTIVIPSYIRKRDRRALDTFLTIIMMLLILVSFFVVFFRIPVIRIITRREGSFIQLSGQILPILIVSNCFSVISSITAAFFQCVSKYNTPKVINFFSHLLVVVTLLLFENINIYQYAILVSLGLFINLILNVLVAMRCGWRYRLTFYISRETMELFKLFIPIVFSTGVYNLSLMVDSAISSRLDVGYVTILNYSNQLSGMVNTLIVGNLLVFFYPRIVERIEEKGNQKEFWNLSVFLHSIICLIIAGFVATGLEGISILFEHGKFSHDSVRIVFYCGFLYIFGQQTNIVRDLIYRYFYARGYTKAAAQNSIGIGICNMVMSLILVRYIGIYGIVLGTILASLFSLIAIMFRFRSILGFDVQIHRVIISYIRNEIILILTIVSIVTLKRFLCYFSDLVSILLFGVSTVIIYLALTLLVNRQVFDTARQI